jgi:hypothetical protein
MNYRKALLAGVVGGIGMSIVLAMARLLGMPANLELMLGSMLTRTTDLTAWIVGFVMHLIISALIALVYAAGFEYLTHRAGWLLGLAFSIPHAIIAGIFMGMVPAMHPLIPEQMPAPGAFMANLGIMGVIGEFMAHMVYGAIVGALYQPVLRYAEQRATSMPSHR